MWLENYFDSDISGEKVCLRDKTRLYNIPPETDKIQAIFDFGKIANANQELFTGKISLMFFPRLFGKLKLVSSLILLI